MPITPGFWAHINDLLGVGKQELVMDGERADSLKAFVKRALPSQKCLVKQVSLAVCFDPDILGSRRLLFIWHTPGRIPGWGGHQKQALEGPRRWPRGDVCPWPLDKTLAAVYVCYDSQRERLWEVDESVCLGRSLVCQPASRRKKRKTVVSTKRGSERNKPERNPAWRSTRGSHSGERRWHQSQRRGTRMPALVLLSSPSSTREAARCPRHSLAVGPGAGLALSPHLCFPICKVRKLPCSEESSRREALGGRRGGPG